MLEKTTAAVKPLSFKVDWGGANLVRAGGWLAQWVWEQTAEHRPSVLATGRGMGDNLAALASGEVEVALATPASFARLALEGRGPFQGRGIPGLVAIGALPHRDAMIPVARREFGFSSLSDVAAYEGPLRVSLGSGDQDGFMGFGAEVVLAAAGIDLDKIVARGGRVTRHEQPFDAIADLRHGRADLMISEAIMTPDWQDLGHNADVTFISLNDTEADAIKGRWGLGTITIPGGYLPGQTKPLRALDYSDWIVATTRSLPDETAALLARAFVKHGAEFERGYRHLPVDYSPLRYPIDHRVARHTGIELHPAAAAEYNAADRTEEGLN